MQTIKLDATDSTNTYLKNLARRNELEDFTTVVTHEQLKGKGQMGATWKSEAGKNLTFSTLKKFNKLSATNGFLLNICASLAVSDVLKRFSVPNINIKWPNDILSGDKKICGILVENLLHGNQIKNSIIGIGLNVNQTIFHTIANATSMNLLLGHTYNLDTVRGALIDELKNLFISVEKDEFDTLRSAYEQQLFRKDTLSTFKNVKGNQFMGFIRGVSEEGRLLVELEDAILQEFELKQIQMLY